MEAKTKSTNRKPVRECIDAERNAQSAFMHLKALAALMETASASKLEFDEEEFYGLGNLIREETKRVEKAFYEVWNLAGERHAAPKLVAA